MTGIRNEIALIGKAASKPSDKAPYGYDSKADFLQEMRTRYDNGYSFNEHNILAGKDDAKFVIGEQWDERVRSERDKKGKPTLTFNHLVAFMAQVIGNRLVNETEIRVHPEHEGKQEVAEIREGLIRSIFKNSHSDFARDEAAKYQVIGGLGYFTLAVEYVSDDVFEQEIKINPVVDPYAVVLDPLSIEPSGEDAQYGFVSEDIPHQEFKRRWPWAAATDFSGSTSWNESGRWFTEDVVRIATYWCMENVGTKTLALMQDGTVKDVSDLEQFEYINFVELRSDGTPYIREAPRRVARRYLVSGNEILEGPHDLPISSLPIYRVPGWEVSDGTQRHVWGLIRFLKDPARLNNYWRSVNAEQLIAAPRNKVLTTPEAVQGHEERWRKAATSDDPLLYYNADSAPPVPVPPVQIDTGVLQQASQTEQDLKSISNIHEAALGMPSNEVSRVAIQARQQVSDVGTFIYTDRRRIADQRCGKHINELIPYIYDTQRMVTVIGRDSKEAVAIINDPTNPMSDVTMGKYGVKISTGPASETKRTLASEQMMSFVNAMPQTASMVMDLVAEAMDWPKAEQFARRFRMALPPGVLPPEDLTPEMRQQQAQASQMAQMQAQVEQATAAADIAAKQAKAANDEARARLAEAQAYKAIMDAQARTKDVDSKVDERAFKQGMEEVDATVRLLDQHNNIAAEDRDFERTSAPPGQENI